jgi:DNA-binding response OmpR family regulator
MYKARTSAWRELCLEAVKETEPERRMAIVIELGRILRDDIHKFGLIQVDVVRAQVTKNGKPVYLTNLEYQLLLRFIERAGRPVSRDELLRLVWGYEGGTTTRTVEVHVHHLRQKLEEDVKRPSLIITVPGMGYKLAARTGYEN